MLGAVARGPFETAIPAPAPNAPKGPRTVLTIGVNVHIVDIMSRLSIDQIPIRPRSFPLAAPRSISRETSTDAELIEAIAMGAGVTGIGQAAPTPHWGESVARALADFAALCAAEDCHVRVDLPQLEGLYSLINIKLDKGGGLTEALALARDAKSRGFGLMVGCAWGTTLGIAPAFLIA